MACKKWVEVRGSPPTGKFCHPAGNSRYRIDLREFYWVVALERRSDEATSGDQRSATTGRQTILQKRDALHAGNLKSLSAAHVLAHHHVVPPQHIRLRFRKLRPIAIVGPGGQILLLHAHQPLDLVLRRLMAVRTT